MTRDEMYPRVQRLKSSESDCSATAAFRWRKKSQKTPGLHFALGSHNLEIRPWLERSIGDVADIQIASYVGLYDGYVSASASEPHVVLQMLLRRHSRKKRSDTIV